MSMKTRWCMRYDLAHADLAHIMITYFDSDLELPSLTNMATDVRPEPLAQKSSTLQNRERRSISDKNANK